jgi:cation:H+ antiporter
MHVSDNPRGRPVGRPPRRGSHARPAGGARGKATVGRSLAALPVWQARLAGMAAISLPGVLLRISGAHAPPQFALFAFGSSVVAAAFLLAWAAEAAEIDVSPGLAVAGVALVAVLPEYVIEIYFAASAHVEYVTASLTGSTRLLLSFAVGMPAIASVVLARRGGPRLETVELKPQRLLDLAIIAAASLYAPLIVLRGHLALGDAAVLIGLYVAYLRRVATGTPEPPHLIGMAAELGKLPKERRRRWVAGIIGYSAVTVLITAEPFADAVLGTGALVGVSPYLAVQWLVPLATESPELVIAFVLIAHRRPGQGVAVLLSSAVSQWTLALGTLPVAFKLGAGTGPLPLLAHEQIELLLTMGQALLAVSMLVTLRLGRRDSSVMLALFAIQLVMPSPAIRAVLAIGYLVLAVDILASERWAIRTLRQTLRRGPPEPAAAPAGASARSRPAR